MKETISALRKLMTRPTQAYDIRDPDLTVHGIEQCQALQDYFRKNLPLANEVELIVTSPMIRTLHTTSLVFAWLIKQGVPVVARAEWQGDFKLRNTISEPY